jgi:hypothetical protein
MIRFGPFISGMLSVFLALPVLAAFEDEPITYKLSGYWQARSLHVGNLFLGQADYNDIGRQREAEDVDARLDRLGMASYLRHQMRLSPELAYRKMLSLKMDVDVLDGVVWGDNAQLAPLALFAASPSQTDQEGQSIDGLAIRRLWMELNIPVGVLRIGRQPSHWGLGLLANRGDGLETDFGDFHRGSSADRILFATKPVQIAQTIMGNPRAGKGWGSKLVMALAYDQVVDLAQKADGKSLEAACITCAPQVLLADPNDDVYQVVGVLAYKDEKAHLLTETDTLIVGVYGVHRVQRQSLSDVWIVDAHLKLRLGQWGLESEILLLNGTSEAIDNGTNPKTINIKGGVVRLGYYDPELDIELEGGWAPGDTEVTDAEFKGYPFHADYNVGLLLYDHILAAGTAGAWTKDERGLWSKGGVWNSKYLYPKVRWRPRFVEGMRVTAAFLWAVADVDTNAVWFQNSTPSFSDLNLGYEFDLAVRYDFFRYVHAKMEAGYFIPGRALWKDVAPSAAHDGVITSADRPKNAWTLQMRLGMTW